jgi:small subunit ribosomal protein S2
MFVAAKKQAKEIVAEAAARANMPYVTERWLGGMLTNFTTIRKSVKKMLSIEKMLNDGTMDSVTKKERLTLTRSKEKMEKVLGGISQMGRVPAAIFMVDISHEHIALAEAKRLGITTFAMVDTNSDPTKVDYAIPANDDATKSIAIITQYLTSVILEGLQERAQVKETEEDGNDDEMDNRGRGLDMNEEEGEGGRRGGRGRGRSAGAGAGAGAGAPGRGPGGGAGRPGGAGRGPGGPGRGPGGGSGRPGGGGSRPGGPGGNRPGGGSGAPRPGGGR